MDSTKRFNLTMPVELHWELQEIADRHHVQVVDIIRQFIKLGLMVDECSKKPDTAFIIREGDREREIVLI